MALCTVAMERSFSTCSANGAKASTAAVEPALLDVSGDQVGPVLELT